MSILEIKDLNKIFYSKGLNHTKDVHVLKNVDLTLNEGEIVALVGESGCGKTTLGKIITGLLEKTTGTIKYMGKEVTTLSKEEQKEFRRAVQFIQQDSYAALNPVKTIYQSLYLPIKQNFKKLKRSEINHLIEEYLSMVGLNPPEQFLSKYPHQLSGGQRQRILIARVLSLKPKLIVADEPISMVDVSLRLSILNLLGELNKKLNVSIVYITHDLSTVRYVVDEGKIAVMYLGEIVEFGNVNEVICHPKFPYTQALISSVPIPNPKLQRSRGKVQIKSMEVPDIRNRPNGCAFYQRCLYADEDCQNYDLVNQYTDEHIVKCKNLKKIPEYKLEME